MEMISKGYSKEDLGSISKRVTVNGQTYYSNASSADNGINTTSYKNLSIYSPIAVTERRVRKENDQGSDSRMSQISTLPGPHKETSDSVKNIRMKPEFFSHINELPGFLTKTEPVIDKSNPNAKLSRFTITSVEQQNMLGNPKPRSGPRQEIIPSKMSDMSNFNTIGKERQLDPYSKGRQTNRDAQQRLLSSSTAEKTDSFSKRGRPVQARDMFQASIPFLS